MSDLIYQWIDLIWLPVAWFAVAPRHRPMALAYAILCVLTMRTQIELMHEIGYETGILPLMSSGLFERGLVTYGIINTLFLLLAHFSPRVPKIIFLAAMLSIYVFAICVSMVVMVL